MKITRVIVRAYDNRSELLAFVTIMMVLASGILAKFDAAVMLFHHGALSLGAR